MIFESRRGPIKIHPFVGVSEAALKSRLHSARMEYRLAVPCLPPHWDEMPHRPAGSPSGAVGSDLAPLSLRMLTQTHGGLLVVAFLAMSATAYAARASPHVTLDVTVDGPEKWEAVLNNIDNVKAALGEKTQIRVVAHGMGLGLLVAASAAGLKDRLKALSLKGVVFAACENTMRKQNVTKEELFPFVITVDSGIADLVRKQRDGWAYIKPG